MPTSETKGTRWIATLHITAEPDNPISEQRIAAKIAALISSVVNMNGWPTMGPVKVRMKRPRAKETL